MPHKHCHIPEYDEDYEDDGSIEISDGPFYIELIDREVTGPFHEIDETFDGWPLIELYEMVPYLNAKGWRNYHRCLIGRLSGRSSQPDVVEHPAFGRRFYLIMVRGLNGRVIDQGTIDLRWPPNSRFHPPTPASHEAGVVQRLKAETTALRARAEEAEGMLCLQADDAAATLAERDAELARLRAENERLAAELAKTQAAAGEQLAAVERQMAQWTQWIGAPGHRPTLQSLLPSSETILKLMKLLDAGDSGAS